MSNWSLILALIGIFASFPSGSYGYKYDDNPDLIFMPPYRCLDRAFKEGPRGRFFPMRRDIRDLMSEIHSETTLEDKPECGVIDPAWCKGEGQNYPIPCNCHAYFTCNVLDASGDLKPCPHWCEPRGLVFDSNTQVCVKFDQAPPGICYDTPSTSLAPTTAPPTTEEITTEKATTEPITTPKPTTTTLKPTTTTPEPTTTEKATTEPITTPKPTTTTPKPTTTTPKPTTTPGPGPEEDCDFDGQKLPFPGNCHDYYVCFADENGKFTVQVFSCGTDWVYDPNTGSCTWPEEAADDLCDY